MSKIDLNFLHRYTKQSYDGSTSSSKVRASNRKLIYGKYRSSHVFRSYSDERFLSCAFTPDDQCLLVGTCGGLVCVFNKYNDNLIAQKKVHPHYVSSLVPHKSGDLLLTSGCTSNEEEESALWFIKNDFENQLKFNDCGHAEFTHAQDKVLGTSGATAKLYDLNSGQVIHEFKPRTPKFRNNEAALNPSDELLLTDGVMFDVRSGKQVHRFKQMNSFVNGKFHANGLKILISSQIYDLRTFHLLQTVEKLKFCKVKFNNFGDVIYGFHTMEYYGTDFKVFDATDYSSIATINNCNMFSLAVNPMDTQIAMAENIQLEGKSVHLYDIGMVRHEEEVDAMMMTMVG